MSSESTPSNSLATDAQLIIYSALPSHYALGPAETCENVASALSKYARITIISVGTDRLTGAKIDASMLSKDQQTRPFARIFIPNDMLLFPRLFRYIAKGKGPLVLHCLFDYRFVLVAFCFAILVGRKPIFHFPHGMLLDAVFEHNRFLKTVFCWVYRLTNVGVRVTHIASSKLEERDIRRRLGPRASVYVIPQVTSLPPEFRNASPRGRIPNEPLQVCFVGRVCKQKNLIYAIEILSKLDFQISMDVIGSIEDEAYFYLCKEKIRGLPGNIQGDVRGPLERSELLKRLPNYDILFAPTLGENHGHSILEALGVGLPVLISDLCPWTDINDFGGGWSFPLSKRSLFADALRKAFHSGPEWADVRRSAYKYFDEKNNTARIEADYVRVILGAGRQGS